MTETKPIITLAFQIRRCDGKPTPEWVHHAFDICKQNTLPYPEYHDFGFLRMLVEAQEFMRITGAQQDFPLPTKPVAPNHDAATTAVGVARDQANHQKENNIYLLSIEVEKAIRAQLLASVDEAYLLTLKHDDLGWHNVTPKAILDHLFKTYGKISSVEITAIEDNMRKPWHPSHGPIEPYWKQLLDGVTATKHCTRGQITKEQALTYAIANFAQSDVPAFKEALRVFDNKPAAAQTFAALQTLITDAYNDLPAKDKAPLTSSTAGYNSANNMEEKENAQPYPHYCWSHGVTWTSRHTSKTCHAHRRFPNHNEEATFYNLCGGCTRILRRGGDKAIWQPKNPTTTGNENK